MKFPELFKLVNLLVFNNFIQFTLSSPPFSSVSGVVFGVGLLARRLERLLEVQRAPLQGMEGRRPVRRALCSLALHSVARSASGNGGTQTSRP